MSIGRMSTIINIVEKVHSTDAEGFGSFIEVVRASVHALKEGRHSSEKWANFSAFSEATVLFKCRVLPHLTVTPLMLIIFEDKRYEIVSVENVNERGMYLEILCKEVKPSG